MKVEGAVSALITLCVSYAIFLIAHRLRNLRFHRFQFVLVNRLVLSLSDAANPQEDTEFRSRTGLEPPTFAAGPFLGNIGGPVRTIEDDLDDDIVLEGGEGVDAEMTDIEAANVMAAGVEPSATKTDRDK